MKTWPARSQAISEALARHEYAEAKRLLREKPVTQEAPVILPMEHPLDCDCSRCEDVRRVSIGLAEKDPADPDDQLRSASAYRRRVGVIVYPNEVPSPELVAKAQKRKDDARARLIEFYGVERFKELQRRMRGL